ncbi:MAG: NAD-dependent epimerase/dehydratase family protein [Chloroflexota bacterium]
MRILILGGTKFVGRHLVEAALAGGHDLTLFNRGREAPNLFPEIEKLRGDRDGGLNALRGRRWDAVIDTCGYVPRVVQASATALADAVDRYIFVSSLSVYAGRGKPWTDETGDLAKIEDETVEKVTGETYGGLKVLCERAAEEALPGRVLTLRPGVLVGPFDGTDRFTYWPHRVNQGGAVLAPGRPQRGIQFTDARDLADWTIDMVERRAVGIYNVQGPEEPLPMGAFLETCRSAGGGGAELVWVDDAFLEAQGVEPWDDLPFWQPEGDHTAGFFAFDARKARAEGLRFRALETTVRDVLAWDATRGADHELRTGWSREREAEVLQAWRQAKAPVSL